jgi:hypothetical protein
VEVQVSRPTHLVSCSARDTRWLLILEQVAAAFSPSLPLCSHSSSSPVIGNEHYGPCSPYGCQCL